MNTYFRFSMILLIVMQLLIACDADDDVDPITRGRYENGVVVLNEGNFGGSNGTIAFYDQDSSKVLHQVFSKANNGAIIGATIVSATYDESRLYILSNSPDKLDVVELENFEAVTNAVVSDDLIQPRQMLVIGDKGYITCWGSFSENWTLPDSYVAVIDLQTFSITNTIDTGDGAEGIILAESKIFVADNYSNTITIIDPATESVIDEVEVLDRPENFAIDANGDLWIACEGPLGMQQGGIVKFDPNQNMVIDSWTVEGESPTGKIAINDLGTIVYYLTGAAFPDPGTSIFSMATDATELSITPLIDGQNFYGLGVDPKNGNLFVGDAQGFAIDGNVLIYDSTGAFIKDFLAGRGPAGFIFL